ncbi:hypothetical protein HCN44_003980 [Aphidius gifuensis]|uniref:General transcription factor IIE subunit 1 n=1 Tax=Aphidius gifuensis TaxID=684658 RepID=A0A834XYA3_APHGI|nr:general transcription factor IIE subunit 1 [Aphidius gifuensis]XP_044002075.1 general transcription factor IIE subunit 1 [Aphidius gifuensis]XP_044002076.1 general transcription factor IIE subunit 1 [Aphidius gifuensis]KAF7994508.1 hypothetical protein HCN44_003980 [Aphidius gifuensis]
MGSEERYVTEVPSSLKQLARLVVRGFYAIEESLIVDMLVRNPCMKEDDICELLKFERKMLRAKISTLRTDKFIQVRVKMETGSDGKAQKVNYYYINYKSFVNVVKYKLHTMGKRLETEERDSTSRASFKCTECFKTFTDLEADQLFDPMTGEFRCTYCNSVVEEDQSALPKKETRMLLAKLNDRVEPLYQLLREVEGIKLAPEILEPEPVDISVIRGESRKSGSQRGNEQWSGEATRGGGFAAEDTRVNVTIGDDNANSQITNQRKETPIWSRESTVVTSTDNINEQTNQDSILDKAASTATITTTNNNKQEDDIMSVLRAHEKKGPNNATANAVKAVLPQESSDSSDNEDMHYIDTQPIDTGNVGVMDSEDEEDDDSVPTVTVAGRTVSLTDVISDAALVAEMTPDEKEAYNQTYQEYYSHMHD